MTALRQACAAALLAPLLAACGGKPAAPTSFAAAGPALSLLTVAPQPLVREQRFDGVLEAVNQSTVAAQTSGRVVELPVDVNTAVQKGEALARLSDVPSRARLAAARAALNEAQAEYQRVKAVYDKRLVAKAHMDRAQAARDAAQAAYDSAADDEAHAVVRAPYAGIVTARHVELGELAQPGRPLVTLLSLDRLRAVVDVPQQFVGALRDHPAARVILPDGTTVPADRVQFFPYADERTHTFRARVEFSADAAHGLYPGELIKVAFAVASAPALAVPASALARRGEVTGVYVAHDKQRLEFRAVRTGAVLPDGRVEIVAGLSAGERIAVDPVAAAQVLRAQEGARS